MRNTAQPPDAVRITIQVASRLPGIPAPAALRKWADATLGHDAARHHDAAHRHDAAYAGAAAIVLRIVNRAEGRRLNRAYRNKDDATNVLTFAYGVNPLEADIVLCAPVVANEARAQGKLLAAHYAHLTVHGVLHALGFDHEKNADARRMEAREIEILSKLGIPDPYR